MATILDTSLLNFFLPAFAFLFIWAICYAFLSTTKIFGPEAKYLNLVASFSVAAIAILSGDLVDFLGAITPWIMLVIVLMVFIFMIMLFFGKREPTEEAFKDIWPLMGRVPIFIIILIIALVGISSVYEETVSPYAVNEKGEIVPTTGTDSVVPGDVSEEKTPSSEAIKTLVHPRVLGALFMLIIAAITIQIIGDIKKPAS